MILHGPVRSSCNSLHVGLLDIVYLIWLFNNCWLSLVSRQRTCKQQLRVTNHDNMIDSNTLSTWWQLLNKLLIIIIYNLYNIILQCKYVFLVLMLTFEHTMLQCTIRTAETCIPGSKKKSHFHRSSHLQDWRIRQISLLVGCALLMA